MARSAGIVVLIVALAVLWAFPIVLFPNPGANDAIELANYEFLGLLAALLGVVVTLIIRRHRATVLRISLGVFLLGAAADFVIGLFAFGNLSNDRYIPLVLLPVPIGLAGLVVLVVGAALSGMKRPDLIRGAVYGLGAAVVVGVWILARGSRDWLLAPYGFDVTVLIAVLIATLIVLGSQVSDAGATG